MKLFTEHTSYRTIFLLATCARAITFTSFTDNTREIKCVEKFQMLMKENATVVQCMFLCLLTPSCVGTRFEPDARLCYQCTLMSEVASGSTPTANVEYYTKGDELTKFTVAARIKGDNEHLPQGRVEIRYNGTWGVICYDRWFIQLRGHEYNNIAVMCRMLGYSSTGLIIPSWSRYKDGEEGLPIWTDDVECTGTERTIADCPFRGFGVHDCDTIETVNLQCDP